MEPRRIKKVKVRFDCQVDQRLLELANAARKKTWPQYTEEMLEQIVAGQTYKERCSELFGLATSLMIELEQEIRSEYEGTKGLVDKLKPVKQAKKILGVK